MATKKDTVDQARRYKLQKAINNLGQSKGQQQFANAVGSAFNSMGETARAFGKTLYNNTAPIVAGAGYGVKEAIYKPFGLADSQLYARQNQTNINAARYAKPEQAQRLYNLVPNELRANATEAQRLRTEAPRAFAKTSLSLLGAQAPAQLLGGMGFGGVINGAVNAFQGKSVAEGVGQGMAGAIPYAGINVLGIPLTNKLTGMATQQIAKMAPGVLKSGLAQRGIAGVVNAGENIAENYVSEPLFTGQLPTLEQNLLAGGAGMGFGMMGKPNVSLGKKGSKTIGQMQASVEQPLKQAFVKAQNSGNIKAMEKVVKQMEADPSYASVASVHRTMLERIKKNSPDILLAELNKAQESGDYLTATQLTDKIRGNRGSFMGAKAPGAIDFSAKVGGEAPKVLDELTDVITGKKVKVKNLNYLPDGLQINNVTDKGQLVKTVLRNGESIGEVSIDPRGIALGYKHPIFAKDFSGKTKAFSSVKSAIDYVATSRNKYKSISELYGKPDSSLIPAQKQPNPLEALQTEARKYGAEVEFINRKPTKAEGFAGKYRDGKIIIYTKGADGKQKTIEQLSDTILHETGHAVDYKRRGITADPMGDSIADYDGKPRAMRDDDIYFRDNRSVEAKGIRTLIPRKDGAANTQKEIYADAFRLYKSKPKELQRVAPRIYGELDNYFKSDKTPTIKEAQSQLTQATAPKGKITKVTTTKPTQPLLENQQSPIGQTTLSQDQPEVSTVTKPAINQVESQKIKGQQAPPMSELSQNYRTGNKKLKLQVSPQSGAVAVESSKPIVTPKDAIADFDEWQRALISQEKLLTPKQLLRKQSSDLNSLAETASSEIGKATNKGIRNKIRATNLAEKASVRKSKDLAEQAAEAIGLNTQPTFLKPEKIPKLRDISNVGKGMTDVYRNFDRVFGQNSQAKKQILQPFDTEKVAMVDDLNKLADDLDSSVVKKLGIDKGSAESGAVQQYGEGLRNFDSLVKEFGEEKAGKIVEADKWFRTTYDTLLDEVNAVRARIYPNNPDKLIPKRKDYYRHFTDLSDSFGGLKNLFESSSAIDPSLAGVSEYAKPKSKWLSFAQKRLGNRTEYDAVGGFIEYAQAQSYAKRIDPFIDQFRQLRQELVDATSDPKTANYGKLNNFIEYLDDYANDLSGKTNPMDRALQKYIGRTPFKVLNWVNSRTKANMIVGNLSSAVAQFFNIPQAIAEAGPINSSKGLVRTLGQVMDDDGVISQSQFLKTRYSDPFNRFDKGLLNNSKKVAVWITQIGDSIGTRYAWNSLYEKAIAEGIESPIKYADDMTRKMVAGRGIGEVPLLQKAKVFQLVAPFQLEVANIWHVMNRWSGEKAANKFVTFFVASYVMNRMAEYVRGSDVSFDPINAGVEAFQTYQGEEDKKLGLLLAAGRMAGEIVSNVPLGSTAASMYPEFGGEVLGKKLPTREKLFGEGDPTRFGTGPLALKGIMNPQYMLLPPFGGKQLERTIDGVQTMNRGYSESKTGKVQFPIDQNPLNYARSATFGKYSTPEARQYFNNKESVLGDKQTETFKNLPQDQAKEYYQRLMVKRDDKEATNTDTSTDPATLPSDPESLKILYKDAQSTIKGYRANKVKSEAGLVEKDVEDYQAEVDKAIQLKKQIEQQYPDFKKDTKGIYTYEDAEGAEKTIDISKVTKMPSTSKVDKIQKKKETYSMVTTVMKSDLSEEKKQQAITELGVSKKDADYYLLANEDNDVKIANAYDVMEKSQNFDDFMKYLVNGRRPVNGKILVTDGVITDLVDQGYLPESVGKELKDIDLYEDGSRNMGKIRARNAKSSKARANKIEAIQRKDYEARVKAFNQFMNDIQKINTTKSSGSGSKISKVNVKNLTFSGR